MSVGVYAHLILLGLLTTLVCFWLSVRNFLLLCRYLASGDLRDANYVVDEVKKQLESKEVEFPESDLMDFVNYLLQT